MMFNPFRMGFVRSNNPKRIQIPDTAPEMSFGANSTKQFHLAWQDQPTSGNIDTLVSGGYLSFTGTITAEYYSGYWRFTITSGAKIVVKQFRKLKRLYISYNTQCTWVYNKAMPKTLTYLYLTGNTIYWTYTGALPAGLTFVDLFGSNIKWIWNGNLPTGLTYLYLFGANIRWDYEGALPTELTYLYLNGANIRWDYEGALPTELTHLYLNGANIRWTYEGSLPIGLSGQLYLSGANINWTYKGALPTELTYLHLNGNNISWTYEGALPTGLSDRLYLIGANINWTGWGVQASFSFGAKILTSGNYGINIGNSPVATEAETAHFLTELEKVAANNTGGTITLTFKKTTPITSEQYLPIIQAFTSKNYNIVLGS